MMSRARRGEITIDDATFVRAPTPLVYRRLTDLAAWPVWWPHARIRELPRLGGDERWALSLRAGPATQLRLGLTCVRWRHEAGLVLAVQGDLAGRVELWLEPVAGGTVVHHLGVIAATRRWPRRTVIGYRRAVRAGLWGFKDALHLEMRTAIGVHP